MSPLAAVTDALETWREAERLFDELPALSPDHETAALICRECRRVYQRLATTAYLTNGEVRATRDAIAETRRLLRDIRAKHVPAVPRDPSLESR